jgi:hypothetical protein
MALGIKNIPKEVQPSLTSPESQMAAVKADPNSLAAISERTQVIAAQAVADSEYDPSVPPPRRNISGFTDYGRRISFLLLLLATLLIVILAIAIPAIQKRVTHFIHLMPTIRSRK